MKADTDPRALARQHLAPHFTRSSVWRSEDLPVFVRGEGCYLWDDGGRRFLDGLSGLFCVNIGHGRADIAAAASKQIETLAYASNWSAAHPTAIEAASLIADLAPGDLDAVFFVNSGSEAVESALKFARQYHIGRGQPERTKIIARQLAYHGTSLGALSVTGLPTIRQPFEPMLFAGVRHVPNTLGCTVPPGGTARDLSCVRAIEETILAEGPETVSALFAEPVQNGRGALVPPAGYWQELRALCDRYGILLVADEVICGFGRLGEWFGSTLFDVVPDIVTFAKGATSAYAPLGGMVLRRPVLESVFDAPAQSFTHGATFGGHPVSTAIAVANITAMRDEGVLDNVRDHAPVLRSGLDELAARHRSIREVRGAGYFYALELTGDRETGRDLTDEQSLGLQREVLPAALLRAGLVLRPDDRGATMIMISPPLISDDQVIGELLDGLDTVVSEAEQWLRRG